jgi:hypothetical protein
VFAKAAEELTSLREILATPFAAGGTPDVRQHLVTVETGLATVHVNH